MKRVVFVVTLIFILAAFLFFPYASLKAQSGIVPCGHDKMCTLCDLILGIKNLFDYGVKIIAAIALLCVFLAGAMYMVSSGNENMLSSAKAFLRASLIGLAVVLGSWVIVNTIITVIMPTKSDLGIGKTSWSNFGDINCSSSSSSN